MNDKSVGARRARGPFDNVIPDGPREPGGSRERAVYENETSQAEPSQVFGNERFLQSLLTKADATLGLLPGCVMRQSAGPRNHGTLADFAAMFETVLRHGPSTTFWCVADLLLNYCLFSAQFITTVMGGGPAVSAALSNQTSWDRALQKYFDFRSLLV